MNPESAKSAGFVLETADWASHAGELYAVRRIVFIEEQGVPEAVEHDAWDAHCRHVLARDLEGRPIGTGRLLDDGHIGRLAVLKPWRGRGVGRALMDWLLALARRQGMAEVCVNAQTRVLDFYTDLGFQAQGEVFYEAGIPHRRMYLRLNAELPPER